MEGSARDSIGTASSWLRCYRCWSQNHEVQVHYEGVLKVDPETAEAVEDRWERMVAGTPWVASCTVTVDGEQVESCSGPDAADSLAFGAFGDHGTREFFTHVRFHKHDGEQIVIHMLVELYARSAEEASDVLEDAARGDLAITSLAEESRPPAHAADEAH